MKYIILLVILIFLVSSFGRWRYKKSFSETSLLKVKLGLSGAEVARRYFSDFSPIIRVQSLDSMVTNFYSSRTRCLYLSPRVFNGCDAGSWGIALHEAGHAKQDSLQDPNWRLRSRSIPLFRFGGGLIFLFTIILALTPMVPPMIAVMIGGVLWFLLLLLCLFGMGCEYFSSQKAAEWLTTEKLLYTTDEEDAVSTMLGGACWREVGDFFRAPLLFFHHLVPLFGRKTKGEK